MTRMLAQKYRPRRLSDVVGQRHATSVLRRALAAHKLPQQLLFSGGSGLGKTTLARCVAAALLCENPQDSDACMECESCLDIATPGRVHPDVVEFDAASNGQKEQVKDLAARAMMAPQRGEYRVYIIDEAHGLSLGGGQAFLKLLEEPPSHVIFMLATTDPEKMLRTNRGRCVEFELARPTDEELAAHLQKVASDEGWSLTEPSALAIIEATDPALGLRGLLMTLEKLSDTLSWGGSLDESEVSSLLGLPPLARVKRLLEHIDAHDRLEALKEAALLRAQVSDDALRRALVLALRRRVLDSGSPLDVLRYEQAVVAPPGRLHTEVLLCRLAAPELDPSATALAAHKDEAAARLKELASALAASPRPEAKPAPQTAPTTGPQVAKQAVTTPSAPPVSSKAQASSSTRQSSTKPEAVSKPASQPARPAKPQVPAEKGQVPTPSALDNLVRELEKDTKAKPALAALKASAPQSTEDRVTLSPPSDALRKRLDDNRDVLRKAAAAAGVKLTIKK